MLVCYRGDGRDPPPRREFPAKGWEARSSLISRASALSFRAWSMSDLDSPRNHLEVSTSSSNTIDVHQAGSSMTVLYFPQGSWPTPLVVTNRRRPRNRPLCLGLNPPRTLGP